MSVVVAANQKGGVAKSTILICLAVYAWQAGYRVVIIDVDEQASAVKWGQRRKGKSPAVVACMPNEIATTIAALRGQHDIVFVDTPGSNDEDVQRVLAHGDLTLIPVSTSWLDLEDSLPTARVLKSYNRTFFYVLAKCPPSERRSSAAQVLLDRLSGRAGDIIGYRLAYQDAIALGLGVTERRAGEAAEEIRALWRWVAQHLGLAERIGDDEA